ncbi:MAG: nuclear transport factor 2 family protein [Pseudolabrys sp.]
MSLDLPKIIGRYFGAQNAHDIDAIVACFASDAHVRDEGHAYLGSNAIRVWKKETSAKYRVTVEPVECGIEGKTTVVVARVSGAFDGSPVNLTYRFGLSVDGQIDALEIRL